MQPLEAEYLCAPVHLIKVYGRTHIGAASSPFSSSLINKWGEDCALIRCEQENILGAYSILEKGTSASKVFPATAAGEGSQLCCLEPGSEQILWIRKIGSSHCLLHSDRVW